MTHTRQDFLTLKECYKWAWVLAYGTAFYETHHYEHSKQFYYLRPAPNGSSDSNPQQSLAIALPPHLFIELVCGGSGREPALEKIRRAALFFEEWLAASRVAKPPAIGDIALYHDKQQQRVGVIFWPKHDILPTPTL